MRKTLLRKTWNSPIAWGIDNTSNVVAGLQVDLLWNSWKELPFFCVIINNTSFSYRNPFKALLLAFEHESIGMAKYERLKEETRKQGWWNKL